MPSIVFNGGQGAGRSVVTGHLMGVELRPGPEGLEAPSNLKGASLATGAGLRPSEKALERPPEPTLTWAEPLAITSGVLGQKSAEGAGAKRPPLRAGQGEGPNLRQSARALVTDVLHPTG